MFTFNKNYFFLSLLILGLEVLIALFAHDNFVRPYLGDVLVVILLYCLIKSFLRLPAFKLAIGVLIFSFVIETLQYIKIVEKLGLGNSKFARTVIGTSFAWMDLLAYVVGILIVLMVERYRPKKSSL